MPDQDEVHTVIVADDDVPSTVEVAREGDQGPQGDPGPTGAPGAPGPPGPPGAFPEGIDLTLLFENGII